MRLFHIYSPSIPIKMYATDVKTPIIEPDTYFFEQTKVLEAVWKHDWHNVRSYLFFNVQKFRTPCAETFRLGTCKIIKKLSPEFPLHFHFTFQSFYFSLSHGFNRPTQDIRKLYFLNCLHVQISTIITTSLQNLYGKIIFWTWVTFSSLTKINHDLL